MLLYQHKKLRSLCAQKLQAALNAFSNYAAGFVTPLNTRFGLNLTLRTQTALTPKELCRRASDLELYLLPESILTDQATAELIFYHSRIPIGEINQSVKEMSEAWR